MKRYYMPVYDQGATFDDNDSKELLELSFSRGPLKKLTAYFRELIRLPSDISREKALNKRLREKFFKKEYYYFPKGYEPIVNVLVEYGTLREEKLGDF